MDPDVLVNDESGYGGQANLKVKRRWNRFRKKLQANVYGGNQMTFSGDPTYNDLNHRYAWGELAMALSTSKKLARLTLRERL